MNPNLRNYARMDDSADQVDPFSLFRLIQRTHPDAFFFQSAWQIGELPQTTIIGMGPFETLRDRDGRAEFSTGSKTEIVRIPFLDVLKEKVNELQVKDGFRYQNGGVFGCIGYDCVREIEPSLKEIGTFKNDGDESVRGHVLIARRLVVFEHKSRRVHLVDAKPLHGRSVIEFLEQAFDRAKAKNEFDHPISISEIPTERLRAHMGYEKFKKNVTEIKAHISAGDIFQAVLSDRFECVTDATPIEIFAKLRFLSPAPYSFYFNFGDRHFLGASPEALVRINGSLITSHPIAGTRPRGITKAEDLRFARQLHRSTKEAAEHLMLVDLARNDVGRVACAGSVNVTSYRQIYRLANVMHLVSEVQAQLRDGLSALDALRACFPAGTLSGAPKIRAMEILATLETRARGLYGGAVVAFDGRGGLESCIAIRSLETEGKLAILRAGAGIVADSKAESEYQEILHKTKLFRVAIAAAELSHEQAHEEAFTVEEVS